MWSLPDIKRMNDKAAAAGGELLCQAENHLDENGEPATCDYCDEPATVSDLWHDIFSDDPKGVIHLCEFHYENYGPSGEGYFYCEHCERTFVENYTWENYYAIVNECEQVCLNCYAELVIEDDDNWLPLTDQAIDELDFEQIRHAPHIVAVKGPVPDALSRIDAVCLDSSTGGRVTGFSNSESGPAGAVEEIRGFLRQAQADGHSRALLVLEAAWQFAVDIGVYVDAEVLDDAPELVPVLGG